MATFYSIWFFAFSRGNQLLHKSYVKKASNQKQHYLRPIVNVQANFQRGLLLRGFTRCVYMHIFLFVIPILFKSYKKICDFSNSTWMFFITFSMMDFFIRLNQQHRITVYIRSKYFARIVDTWIFQIYF